MFRDIRVTLLLERVFWCTELFIFQRSFGTAPTEVGLLGGSNPSDFNLQLHNCYVWLHHVFQLRFVPIKTCTNCSSVSTKFSPPRMLAFEIYCVLGLVVVLTIAEHTDALNATLLWGPYRLNLYLGLRPRIPNSLLLGLMWASIHEDEDLGNIPRKLHSMDWQLCLAADRIWWRSATYLWTRWPDGWLWLD